MCAFAVFGLLLLLLTSFHRWLKFAVFERGLSWICVRSIGQKTFPIATFHIAFRLTSNGSTQVRKQAHSNQSSSVNLLCFSSYCACCCRGCASCHHGPSTAVLLEECFQSFACNFRELLNLSSSYVGEGAAIAASKGGTVQYIGDYIGIMEKKVETTILGLGFGEQGSRRSPLAVKATAC